MSEFPVVTDLSVLARDGYYEWKKVFVYDGTVFVVFVDKVVSAVSVIDSADPFGTPAYDGSVRDAECVLESGVYRGSAELRGMSTDVTAVRCLLVVPDDDFLSDMRPFVAVAMMSAE